MPRASRTRRPGVWKMPRSSAASSPPPPGACPPPAPCSTTRARTSSGSPRRCLTANWNTGAETPMRRSCTCAVRSNWTTGCHSTSRGAGCSRPGMPTAPCSSSRAWWPRLRPSTVRTWAWTTPCPGPASIQATSGACTATTNAWSAWASGSRPGSSSSSSRSPPRMPTCRFTPPAIAGWNPWSPGSYLRPGDRYFHGVAVPPSSVFTSMTAGCPSASALVSAS